MKFIISTDSCCDEHKSVLKTRGIECLAMSYCFSEPVYDNFDSDADYENFYKRLQSGEMSTTSQSNHAECTEYFNTLIEKYPDKDILHFTLSSGLSGTYDVANSVAEEINATLNGHKIYCFDSLAATQGQKYLIDIAAEWQKDGKTAQETYDYVLSIRDRLHHFVLASDLNHLHRGGRLSKAAAVAGGILHLIPIIIINHEGKLVVYDKVIGKRKAMKYFISMLKKQNADLSLPIRIAYTEKEFAEEFAATLSAAHPEIKFEMGWIGPVIGSHTGPGTLGFVFSGNKRIVKN